MRSQRARTRGYGPALGFASLCGVILAGVSSAALAQDADPSSDYAAVLQQIADVETNIAQREFYINQQNERIERLREQLRAAGEQDAQSELLPMLREMVSRLEEVMVEDLPIRVERRFALLDSLRDDLRADDASVYDGFRRAFDILSSEAELGLSVGSYPGNNPINSGGRFAACQQDPESARCDLSEDQKLALKRGALVEDFNELEQLPDGNYIHYGRLAVLYLERDSSEGYRYNADTKTWDEVGASELLGLRQNVRIARGESAISTMVVPVKVGEAADDAS